MDWLSEIVSFMFSLGVGCLLGMLFVRLSGMHSKANQEEQDVEWLQEKIKEEIQASLRLHIREESGCFYAYDAETEEFYAQGTTIGQMMINIRENTKRNKVIIVSSDDGARQHVIAFLEEKLGKTPNTVGL